MITTIIIFMIVTSLLVVIFNEGIEALPLTKQAENYQGALQAAEAGVQDYIARLDANTSYYLKTSDQSNPAMATNSWAPVCPSPLPGSCAGTPITEWYRYAVNNTSTETTGTLYLTVTGASGADPMTSSNYVIRTIKERISLTAFTSSLYYSQYETEYGSYVPQNYYNLPSNPTYPNATYNNYCSVDEQQYNPYWSAVAGRTEYGPDDDTYGSPAEQLCTFVNFGSVDTLDGPVSSADAIAVDGAANFPDGVYSTADQSTSLDVNTGPSETWVNYWGEGAYRDGCNGSPYDNMVSGSANGNNGDCTGSSAPVVFGSSSGWNKTSTTSPVGYPAPGAEISRPTTNDTLKPYLSTSVGGGGCYYQGPITIVFNSAGTMTVTSDGGSVATAPGGSSLPASQCMGSGLAYPANGLIYDDDEPQSQCNGGANCAANVFVQGVVTGPVTIASAGNITVTGDILYPSTAPTSTDMLGLWAQNAIAVSDSDNQIPKASGAPNPVDPQISSLTIDAAMVALNYSIYVPCFQSDSGQSTPNGKTASTTPFCPTLGDAYEQGTSYYVNNTIAGTAANSLTGAPAITGVTSNCQAANVSNPSGVSPPPLGFLTICGSLSQEYRGAVACACNSSTVNTGYAKDYIYDSRLKYLQPPFFNSMAEPEWNDTSFVECNPVSNPASATC